MLVLDCVILMFCGKYPPESYWMPFAGEIVDATTFTERVAELQGIPHDQALNAVGEMWGVNAAGGPSASRSCASDSWARSITSPTS